MAEKIVSPGVFTQENDLSFLAEGVSAIGAAVIGPTEKGPAFVPVQVTSQNEFNTKFGSGTYYTPYTVQNYLKSAGIVTIVRVLGTQSYTRNYFTMVASGSAPNPYLDQVLAIFGATGSDSNVTAVSVDSGSTLSDFVLSVTTGVGTSSYSCSFDSRKSSYVTNVLTGQVPIEVVYNYPVFQSASVAYSSSESVEPGTAWAPNYAVSMSEAGYNNGSTPWIESQNMSATSASFEYYTLFKFHTLADGTSANQEIKATIFDVRPADEVTNSDYGTFGITIRKFTDTDSRPEVLETFANATLDPDSVNYLPRLVGDRRSYYRSIGGESKLVYEGDWPNKSAYVRVELSQVQFPKGAVPMGFAAYNQPVNITPNQIPSMSFTTTQTINGETNTRAYRGINFTNSDVDNILNEVGSILSNVAETYFPSTGSNARFNLSAYTDVITYTQDSGSVWGSNINTRKFALGFQGGNDGLDPRIGKAQGEGINATNTQGFNCDGSGADGSQGYKKGLDAISNPDEVDVNMIVIPGILKKYHSYVANYAINVCEERGDCFLLLDGVGLRDGITEAVNDLVATDTNYAATYFPWVKIIDPNTNKPLWAPPSVVMTGVFSFNDKIGYEWFAPAGLNRGGITEAVEAYTRLTHTERDTLYNARINPIASFPGQGVVAWGQKTLQSKASALDRINVRRLLIALKKYIASSTRYLVFEQNTTATRNRFLNIVNPYLESVQNRAGLYAFKVKMDDTNNTPDIIDRNQLYGQIYLQPTKTAEFIVLDFNILPTGAIFPEA